MEKIFFSNSKSAQSFLKRAEGYKLNAINIEACGCLQKILSNILLNRLVSCEHEVVGEYQECGVRMNR